MNCPRCHTVNDETQKFCRKCGANLQTRCFHCGSVILPSDRFCGECGTELEISKKLAEKQEKIDSELKYITVLFADISGYTALAERLDPEEVKDQVGLILGEIAKVVIKYGGHIEKFAGDQIMAVFGVPQAREDDPVRAVKTASEIHEVVRGLSQKVQKTIGQPLTMHIGINTGLVVTGKFDFTKAVHQIAGDTVNVASRLCTLAKAGETLVGQTTFTHAEGFFSFGPMELVQVKGKTKPVPAHRLLSSRELPGRKRRLSGHRAALVGRQREMAVLTQAMARLREGKGSVIAICGEAGTGKSRLIEEFQATLNLEEIRWVEGHAYAYTQTISYYPLINLIKRDLAIEKDDTPARVAAKLEARLEEFDGLKEAVAPYIGGLLSLDYPEIAEMSPEFWKSRLHQAILVTLQSQAKQAPTVVCFEDLQWADPTFLNFLRLLVIERTPVIFFCTYRPHLKLFNDEEISKMGDTYQEIHLQDLSKDEIQEMLASILQTPAVPEALQRFVQEKVGTNPFYLEEMVNSLIDSEILQLHNGTWRLTGSTDQANIPSTIHAVISGRIDRLEEPAKNLLQEASVIGRTVPYEILKRVTRHGDTLDRFLEELEDLGLVRKSAQSEEEYVFKHTLIQEVVYHSLLKRDRQALHRRIGVIMEQVFCDRLPEFYETLAFHFRHSELSQKAVDYLRESGKKSLKQYAVQESHQYYQRAYQILGKTPGDSEEEKWLLIDFLNEWAQVYYYRADFAGLTKLFLGHRELAESLSDQALLAVFYGWLCITLFCTGKAKESYEYSLKALELGRETKSNTAIGLAYANLTWSCGEMKLLDLGIQYGEEVMAKADELEPMAYFLALGGLGMIYLFKGDSQKNYELGKILHEFGQEHSDLRSIVVGYICTSYGHYTDGDFATAVEWGKKAVELSNDPLFTVWPKLVLATYFAQSEQFQQSAEILEEIILLCRQLGMDYIVTHAQGLYGAVLMAQGQFSRGMKMIESGLESEIYFQMANRARHFELWAVVKNLGFVLKEVPFAKRKAKAYLKEIIQVGREVGAKGFVQGHALLNLGLLYQQNGRKEQAKECLKEAEGILSHCSSETCSQIVRQALGTLN
ncbi:MAG: adenylate/guanylate cyclase domain-containing protein [Deltaproteobacteria bacterium]